jgi:hypothetical protein
VFGVPPYRLAIAGENEGAAMVKMGEPYQNGTISFYRVRMEGDGR